MTTEAKGKCPRCGKGAIYKNQDGDQACSMCGNIIYQHVPEQAYVNVPNVQKKPGRWREPDKAAPLEYPKAEEIRQPAQKPVVNSPPQESKRLGRPQAGLHTKCVDCGAPLYIRPHRLEDGKEYRCRKCASSVSAKLPRKRRGPYAKGKYLDEHRDEILADRLSIGHEATMHKWKIASKSWQDVKQRWREQGIEVRIVVKGSQIKKEGEQMLGKETEHKGINVPEEHLLRIAERLKHLEDADGLMMEADFRLQYIIDDIGRLANQIATPDGVYTMGIKTGLQIAETIMKVSIPVTLAFAKFAERDIRDFEKENSKKV